MSRTLDPARVLRALGLVVERVAPCRYQVSGGSAVHTVRTDRPRWACDCPDALYRRSEGCKHVIGVYLALRLAPPVRDALREATAGR